MPDFIYFYIGIGGANLPNIRGLLHGVFEPYHGRCFPNNTVFDGVSGMDDRQFLMLYGQHATFIACFVLDITGNASGEWW